MEGGKGEGFPDYGLANFTRLLGAAVGEDLTLLVSRTLALPGIVDERSFPIACDLVRS